MLIGKNRLVLNQATVCKAVEAYLNNRIKDDNQIKIESFIYNNNEYMFIFDTIEVKDKEAS